MKLFGFTIEVVYRFLGWEKEYNLYKENPIRNPRLYRQIKALWQEIYKLQFSLVDRGLTLSPWRVPGAGGET